MLDINNIRNEFPILSRNVYNRKLVYLDNAATSQTPRRVVEALEKSYFETKANVHRGVFSVSQEATELMEATRTRVQKYIGAANREEIIFTRGTTEGINLVAAAYGGAFFQDGDEIILVEARLQHLGFREQATAGEDLLLLQLLGGAKAIVGRVQRLVLLADLGRLGSGSGS